MQLFAWICSPFAWKVVRQHDGYTYSENAITGQRRCYWIGSDWRHIDYKLIRLGGWRASSPFSAPIYRRRQVSTRRGRTAR
jgi:hypothetical protein